MSLAEIGEGEDGQPRGARVANLAQQELALGAEVRAAGVVEPLEVGRECAPRVRRRIEPPHGAGADRAVAATAEPVDEVVSVELDPRRGDAAVPAARHPEDLAEFRIDERLAARGIAGSEAHEERRVRAVGEVRGRVGADERADRLEVRRRRRRERVVAARVERDEQDVGRGAHVVPGVAAGAGAQRRCRSTSAK